MRLVRIHVEHFGQLTSAEVELGPGLNILYGPNDLGKSTLFEAVRLALLLPSTSTVHEAWVPWATGHKPKVELVFFAAEAYWRVQKEFGAGNRAELHRSRDGLAWDEVAKARAVDGKLRELLDWGIREPGGANAPKGLPESFLATALLSTQTDVAAVLATSLAGDSADTGRKRVSAALSALAQDPLFKKLLDETNARYDQAFTAHGRKKTAQDGVLKVAAERVRRAGIEREAAQRVVDESALVETTLAELCARRDHAERAAELGREALAELRRLREDGRARELALGAVTTATAELDGLQKLAGDVSNLADEVTGLDHTREALRGSVREAEAAHAAALEELRRAEEAARDELGDGATAETIERQRLELALGEADRRAEGATRTLAELEAARRLAAAAVAREAELVLARERAREASAAGAAAAAAAQRVRDALARLELTERRLELDEAARLEGVARQSVARLAELRAATNGVETRGEALRDARRKLVVPDRKVLARLRKLESDLAIARGALEVGLAVTLEPVEPRDVSVSADGGAARASFVTEPFEVQARGAIEVVLHGVAIVRAVAGSAAGRERERTLAARWTDEALPVLTAAGAATAEGLGARIDAADALDRDVTEIARELAGLRLEQAGLSGAEAALALAATATAAALAALGDAGDLAGEVAGLGREPRAALRGRRAALGKELDASRASFLAADAVVLDRAAEDAARAYASAVALRDEARRAYPDGDLDAAQTAAQGQKTDADGARDAVRKGLESLDASSATRNAARAVAAAAGRRALERATQAVVDARGRLERATGAAATARGRLEALRAQLAATDEAAARAKLGAAQAALAAAPPPAREATEDELTRAAATDERTATELARLQGEIHRAHGALEQVGGAVARDRLRDAEEALQIAETQERDLEADYEAWRLLRDQMLEAEAAQASHLGQALAPGVGQRFAALTGGRYGAVAMSAQLATEGVVTAGKLVDVGRLSMGTREQLATLYRLSLAEHLRTALVLDDQLVQSDDARLDWFRAVLREKASAFQIVVVTCRPLDYVRADALPPAGAPFLDVEDGLVRTIDLERALRGARDRS